MENCLQYNAMHDFTVCLRTGSNPADVNWFRSHTGNSVPHKHTDKDGIKNVYLVYLQKIIRTYKVEIL